MADLKEVAGIPTIPENLLQPYSRAVVFGISFPNDVFAQIEDAPTPLYARQYFVANQILDHQGFLIQKKLADAGFRALAIPASQLLDKQNWMAHVSAKALARAAGLGWIGKNLLLINPRYGSRIRIASVLTNAPLQADPIVPFRCGTCTRCVEACPVEAIRGNSWEKYPESRETALDFEKCKNLLTQDFAQRPELGFPVCGICIKVCPFTIPKEAKGRQLV